MDRTRYLAMTLINASRVLAGTLGIVAGLQYFITVINHRSGAPNIGHCIAQIADYLVHQS